MEKLHGLEWDSANVGHILRHGVIPAEVEDAVSHPHVVVPGRNVRDETRWKLFGGTASGRHLLVVFTNRANWFRAVTAYDMNAAERTIYGSQIGQ